MYASLCFEPFKHPVLISTWCHRLTRMWLALRQLIPWESWRAQQRSTWWTRSLRRSKIALPILSGEHVMPMNLNTNCDKSWTEIVISLNQWIWPCRTHTMSRFVTHEAIASNVLNTSHCSASGVTIPWQHHLTNSDRLLELLVSRMESDWTALAPKMRKPWSAASLES